MIKLLADENIPTRTVESLRRRGVDVISVADISPGLSDASIIDLANRGKSNSHIR